MHGLSQASLLSFIKLVLPCTLFLCEALSHEFVTYTQAKAEGEEESFLI